MSKRFDSRDLAYKSLFGAVPCGQPLCLRLCLPADVQEAAVLLAFDREPAQAISMEREAQPCEQGDSFFWKATIVPERTGLYFYTFRYRQGAQDITLWRDAWNHAVEGGGSAWQLTVYAPDFTTPQWIEGGLIYQIFPDRFFGSGKEKQQVPSDRFCVKNWSDQPAYQPGKEGRVLNNDYWSGDLAGIEQKLDYLSSLGVTCLYLNPIFEAHSNHRYNTADYEKIDPLLGTKEDFISLCDACHRRGIRVILDGVFSHTGSDSRYFNREGRYPELGAFQSQQSPFYDWYSFTHFPDQYAAWWGIDTLPEVREECPSYLSFMTGPNGVLRQWLRAGADGWRLDVADELPDFFLDALRQAVKEEKPDALILGEVWEDASTKEGFGKRRKYLLGTQLDSVMNYPFYQAILRFLKGGNSPELMETVLSVLEHYPAPAVHCLMNHVGTHDTERLLTALAGEEANGRDRAWQAQQQITGEALRKGLRFVQLAAVLQYTLPGVPSLYYGDERGMQGYRDPFNRGAFPWEEGDDQLTAFYQRLGALRRACPAFAQGEFLPVYAEAGHIAYIRQKGDQKILVAVNRWCDPESIPVADEWCHAVTLAGEAPRDGRLNIPAEGYTLLGLGDWTQRISQ